MEVTNIYELPQPFVTAARSEHTYTPKRYSVTSLLKGSCEAVLQRRHADEVKQDASEMVWLVFGSAVHKVLEDADLPYRELYDTMNTARRMLRDALFESDWELVRELVGILDALAARKLHSNLLTEEWLSMPFGEYTMSGIFDLYDDATGTITDYKTASVWKVKGGDWDDYRKQLLCYCLLLRHYGFDAHRGQIVALLKDHSKKQTRREAGYPAHPVYKIAWDFTEAEIAAMRREIGEKFAEIEAQEKRTDAELVPCSLEERWQEPPKWAVTKRGNKRAKRLFDTKEEAEFAAECYEAEDRKKYDVTYRPSVPTKCIDYCSVTSYCPFYQTLAKEAMPDAGMDEG